MLEKNFYLIGGSSYYGSGKIISFLKKKLNNSYEKFNFIETQKSNLGIIKKLIKVPKNSKILFQPSIAFPSFLRDILILLLIRRKSHDLTFILCVDICFKNPIFKVKKFRKIFFKNSKVITIANFSYKLKGQVIIEPFFEKSKLNISIVEDFKLPLAPLHLGYCTKMKGWDKFNFLLESCREGYPFFTIGSASPKDCLLSKKNHTIIRASNTKDIESKVELISRKYFPCLIFLSNADFAPLIVLEAGYWGIPITCIKDTKSENILERFLPRNCFVSIKDFRELKFFREDLIVSRTNMLSYTRDLNEKKFFQSILENLY